MVFQSTAAELPESPEEPIVPCHEIGNVIGVLYGIDGLIGLGAMTLDEVSKSLREQSRRLAQVLDMLHAEEQIKTKGNG
jgi:hypothetical protein